MSWKNDVFSAIKDLASDIKTIRTIDSPDDLLPLGSDIANHIHQLIDVTVNSLDDSTHSKIIEIAKAIKAAAPPLLKAVTSKNQAVALELVEPLTAQLKELNQLLKAGDEPAAAAGGSGVDVEECKKVQKEIKDALLLMNSAHKSKDEEKSKEAAKKLGEECKNLINLASAAGIDIKKSVIDAFKRIENDRVNGSNEQLQETLKEFHKVVKDAQKKLIPEEEKEKKEKSVKPKKPRTSNSQTTNSISNLVEKDDPTDLFTLTKKLGEGATGSVHMAVAKNSKVFAIKKVPLTMKNMEATQKEIKFMKNIHHANTLSYYSCYRRGTEVWIVMELCDGGSVQDILLTTGKGMEEPHIAAVTVQVLSGLEYLHGQQTIHRDIKSGNLLLTSEGKVKIADFGASADTCTNRTTVIGSAFWMAPETLDQSGYDTRADIWSLGITLIEMAEKNPPYFEFKSDFEVIKQIKNCEPATLKPNPKWSENFKQVVKVCLQRDRNKRPSATILLQHPFVKDITDTSGLAALVAEVHQLKKASKGDAAEPGDEVTVDSKPRKNSKKTDKPKEKRTSKSKTAGGPGTEEKVKVHFNSESNIAKRIAVEPSIDAQALAQKCYKQFKIDKEESSAYALYMIQNGTSKKLADNELPYQLLNSSKKDDIQLVYKKQ